jgi:hypothetical protein
MNDDMSHYIYIKTLMMICSFNITGRLMELSGKMISAESITMPTSSYKNRRYNI